VNEIKILHLTLKLKWFLEIAVGYKTIEYREIKPYWNSRLINREYDEVHFRNGYRADSPFMRVTYLGATPVHLEEGMFFAIGLGAVLEVKNINLNSYANPWLTELSVRGMRSGFVSEFFAPGNILT